MDKSDLPHKTNLNTPLVPSLYKYLLRTVRWGESELKGRIGTPIHNHRELIHRIYSKLGQIRIVGQFALSYGLFCKSTPCGCGWVFRFAPLVLIHPISQYLIDTSIVCTVKPQNQQNLIN